MLPKKPITDRKPRTKSPEQALASLMRLCARAEKCEGDARRLMQGWGVPTQEAEAVLARLVRERFIDDSRYAAMFVREKMHLSGWGIYKIRAALQRKQVDKAHIEAALEQVNPEQMGTRLAEQLRCKLRTVKAKTPYDLRTKLMRYGLSLGYDFETVREAVTACAPNTNDSACDDF